MLWLIPVAVAALLAGCGSRQSVDLKESEDVKIIQSNEDISSPEVGNLDAGMPDAGNLEDNIPFLNDNSSIHIDIEEVSLPQDLMQQDGLMEDFSTEEDFSSSVCLATDWSTLKNNLNNIQCLDGSYKFDYLYSLTILYDQCQVECEHFNEDILPSIPSIEECYSIIDDLQEYLEMAYFYDGECMLLNNEINFAKNDLDSLDQINSQSIYAVKLEDALGLGYLIYGYCDDGIKTYETLMNDHYNKVFLADDALNMLRYYLECFVQNGKIAEEELQLEVQHVLDKANEACKHLMLLTIRNLTPQLILSCLPKIH